MVVGKRNCMGVGPLVVLRESQYIWVTEFAEEAIAFLRVFRHPFPKTIDSLADVRRCWEHLSFLWILLIDIATASRDWREELPCSGQISGINVLLQVLLHIIGVRS